MHLIKVKKSLMIRDKIIPAPFFLKIDLKQFTGNNDAFCTNDNYLFHSFYYGLWNDVATIIRHNYNPRLLYSTLNYISCHEITKICYSIKNLDKDSRVRKNISVNKEYKITSFSDLYRNKLIFWNCMFWTHHKMSKWR